MSDNSPGILDRISDFARRRWYFQGIIAAITIVDLVTRFTAFDTASFLSAVHAATETWRTLMSFLGMLIGVLPYIPQLSPEFVLMLFFLGSVAIPEFRSTAIVECEGSWLCEALAFVASFTGASYLFYFVVLDDYAAILFHEYLRFWTIMLVAPVVLMWARSLFVFQGFGKGVVIAISALATFQLLYWLQVVPIVDWVNDLVCRANPTANMCS